MANITAPNTLHYINRRRLLCSFNSTTAFSNSLHYDKSPLLSFSSSLPSRCFRVTRVSTAPIEYVPPAPDFNFDEEISRLKILRSKLDGCGSLKGKHYVIDSDLRVKSFFDRRGVWVSRVLGCLRLEMDSYEVYLLKCLVAAGQEHVISVGFMESELEVSARSSLRSAVYALAEMIEHWGVGGGGGDELGEGIHALNDEEIGDLNQLLKTLSEIEEFYDCIGGIIGSALLSFPCATCAMLFQD